MCSGYFLTAGTGLLVVLAECQSPCEIRATARPRTVRSIQILLNTDFGAALGSESRVGFGNVFTAPAAATSAEITLFTFGATDDARFDSTWFDDKATIGQFG